MEDIYYCPKNPLEHVTFECYVQSGATWIVDADNELIKERSWGIQSMSDYDCDTCGAPAEHGIPPHALELLAREADDAGIET